MKYIQEIAGKIKPYWHDPVLSKVISAGILTFIGSIFVLIKSLYDQVSFTQVTKQVTDYFMLTTEINNLILWVCGLITFTVIISFAMEVLKKIKTKKIIDEKQQTKKLPIISQNSSDFFSSRLAKAFPGHRGLEWYDAKIAVERFKILFQEPLRFDPNDLGYDCMPDPIWWFRGGSASHIDEFKILSKTKVLLSGDELEIKKIAVFISNINEKSFIYVETKAEKPTGLYNFSPESINFFLNSRGYFSEEYAVLGNKPITRQQYDDKATIIKNKVVDASSSKLRVRFLSDYNFVIAAKQSPYNSKKFDRDSGTYLKNILHKKQTPEEFFEYLDSLIYLPENSW